MELFICPAKSKEEKAGDARTGRVIQNPYGYLDAFSVKILRFTVT
jgi:hypothetical protein